MTSASIHQPDLADLAFRQRDQIVVRGGPEAVALEAEIFEAEAGRCSHPASSPATRSGNSARGRPSPSDRGYRSNCRGRGRGARRRSRATVRKSRYLQRARCEQRKRRRPQRCHQLADRRRGDDVARRDRSRARRAALTRLDRPELLLRHRKLSAASLRPIRISPPSASILLARKPPTSCRGRGADSGRISIRVLAHRRSRFCQPERAPQSVDDGGTKARGP